MIARAGNYYGILGARPDASPEELKRAYYRAVRNHPPERDPEGFQRLREAWLTLGDPRARAQYDAMQQHGGEIQRLFEQAETQVEAEDFAGAASSLKRILVLSPEAEAARMKLAFCHLRQQQFAEAAKGFDRLCRQSNATFLYWAAQTRCAWAAHDEARAPALHAEAIRLFLQAIAVDPINAEPYLGLARLHHRRGEASDALACIEKAIAADGRVDFQDFEALYLACLVHLGQDDTTGFDRTLRRIQDLAPDPEQRKYVGWHFAKGSFEAARAGVFRQAARLAEAARLFAPDEDWFRKNAEYLEPLARMSEEFERLQDDFLKALVALELQMSVAPEEEGKELQGQWDQAVEFLTRVDPRKLEEWSGVLKSRCPAFYARNRGLVDAMAEDGRERAPVIREAERAVKDPGLPSVLQGLAALVHDATLGVAKDPDGVVQRLRQVAATLPAADVRRGVDRVRSAYPAVYRAQSGVWEGLATVAGSARKQEDASGCCGCLVMLILAILGANAF